MKRDLIKHLLEWKKSPHRKPIIIRGARQVGKSWLVKEFSKNFSSFAEVNFDQDKEARQIFNGDLNIDKILERLSLYYGKKIIPGETLLFLDEIQECENALRSLRYFKENCPELHVIAAGSLIDFTLEKIGMPVGRVQFFYLFPLSFGEFLTANGQESLRTHIHPDQADPALHTKILEFLKHYMWLGGMPEVVKHWLDNRDVEQCQKLQNQIVTVYKQDFLKYAKTKQIDFVATVFNAIPLQLGNKFKFSHIDTETKTYVFKQALLLLEKAGIAYRCFHSSGQAQPLGATKDEKKFKVFFFDIGLAQKILGLKLRDWSRLPLEISHVGAMAEQLVAQELIAYTASQEPPELYYWHRENRGSNAEVDFLISTNHGIVPVEVKSGVKGGMKSLHVFLESHPNSPFGTKISENNFCKTTELHEVPLYGLESWIKVMTS